jgi:hypothetical protein
LRSRHSSLKQECQESGQNPLLRQCQAKYLHLLTIQSHKKYIMQYQRIFWLLVVLSSCNAQERDLKRAREENTMEAYQLFISEHPSSEHIAGIRKSICRLEYDVATRKGSAEGYQSFMQKCPDQESVANASKRIEEIQFQEVTRVNTVEAYERFVHEHPESPLCASARDGIEKIQYQAAMSANTLESLVGFLRLHPRSSLYKEFALAKGKPVEIKMLAERTLKLVQLSIQNGKRDGNVLCKLQVPPNTSISIPPFWDGSTVTSGNISTSTTYHISNQGQLQRVSSISRTGNKEAELEKESKADKPVDLSAENIEISPNQVVRLNGGGAFVTGPERATLVRDNAAKKVVTLTEGELYFVSPK